MYKIIKSFKEINIDPNNPINIFIDIDGTMISEYFYFITSRFGEVSNEKRYEHLKLTHDYVLDFLNKHKKSNIISLTARDISQKETTKEEFTRLGIKMYPKKERIDEMIDRIYDNGVYYVGEYCTKGQFIKKYLDKTKTTTFIFIDNEMHNLTNVAKYISQMKESINYKMYLFVPDK